MNAEDKKEELMEWLSKLEEPSVLYKIAKIKVLYKKEYFGFIETAEKYVYEIYDAVDENIKVQKHKTTPKTVKTSRLKIYFV